MSEAGQEKTGADRQDRPTGAVQDQYDEAFQVCYGCGARNEHGLQIKSYRDDGRVFASYTPRPHQLGVPGVVYGGLIASLIDCHGIATGAAHFQDRDPGLARPPRCVTAALQVDFRKPTPMDAGPIELSARVVDSSPRKAVVEVEVRAGGEITAEGRVVAVRLPDPGA